MIHSSEAISYDKGKQVQEVLNRYLNQELRVELASHREMDDDANLVQVEKDIAYVEDLVELFE